MPPNDPAITCGREAGCVRTRTDPARQVHGAVGRRLGWRAYEKQQLPLSTSIPPPAAMRKSTVLSLYAPSSRHDQAGREGVADVGRERDTKAFPLAPTPEQKTTLQEEGVYGFGAERDRKAFPFRTRLRTKDDVAKGKRLRRRL